MCLADSVANMCFATGSRSMPLMTLVLLFATIQEILGDPSSSRYTPSTGDIIGYTFCAIVVVIIILIFCVYYPKCGIYKWQMKHSIDGRIYSTSKSVPGYGTSGSSTYPEENVQSQLEGYQQNTTSVKGSMNSV